MMRLTSLNLFVFVLMFVIFLFSSKVMSALGVQISGFEYLVNVVFYLILIVIFFSSPRSNLYFSKQYLYLFGILVLFCVANFFVVEVPALIYFQGAFFSFLFAIHFMLFYNLKFDIRIFFSALKIIVSIITLIGVLAYWERIFVPGSYQPYFLRGVYTVGKDPSFVSTLLNINIIFCLVLYHKSRKRKYLYVVVFSIVTISLLLFIKAFVVSIIIGFAYVRFFLKGQISKLFINVTICVLIASLIFLGRPLLNEITYKFNMYFGEGNDKIPRNALYIASVQMAKDYFPFGCGQGTFGSYPVGKHYSQIYYDYDLDKVHGLGPNDALGLTDSHFIFDTYWPSILGEMGWIAFMIYIFLWSLPAIIAWQYLKSRNLEVKLVAFVVFMVICSVFIESIASPLPGQLQFIHIYSGLGAIGCRLCREMTKGVHHN